MSLLSEIALIASTASSLAALALTALKIGDRRRRPPTRASRTKRNSPARAGRR